MPTLDSGEEGGEEGEYKSMAPSFPEQRAELQVTSATGEKYLPEVLQQFLIKRRCGIYQRVSEALRSKRCFSELSWVSYLLGTDAGIPQENSLVM